MALTPKPFSVADKIIKRIYKGKPNVYADVDINQATDVDEYAFSTVQDALGSITENFEPTLPFVYWDGDLEFEIDYVGGGKLHAKKTTFDIPAFNIDNGGGTVTVWPNLEDGVVNIWFIAEKETVDFTASNSIGGVTGPTIPTPIASSDAVRYQNERVDFTIGADVLPTLSPSEEVIALLCQIAYKKNPTSANGVEPFLLICSPDGSTIDDTVFPGTQHKASATKGVIANLIKLATYVKGVVNPLVTATTDDFIYHDGTQLAPTNFTTEANDRIRTQHHRFLKLQQFGQVVGPTPITGGRITLTDSGNVLEYQTNIDTPLYGITAPPLDSSSNTGVPIITLFNGSPNTITVHLNSGSASPARAIRSKVLQDAGITTITLGTKEVLFLQYVYDINVGYWQIIGIPTPPPTWYTVEDPTIAGPGGVTANCQGRFFYNNNPFTKTCFISCDGVQVDTISADVAYLEITLPNLNIGVAQGGALVAPLSESTIPLGDSFMIVTYSTSSNKIKIQKAFSAGNLKAGRTYSFSLQLVIYTG